MIVRSPGSDQADEWINLGVECQSTNKFPDAERYYRQALRLDPQHAIATQNLGILYAQQNNINEGLLAMERASMFDENNTGVIYANRAFMALEAERIDEALEVAKQGVEKAPSKETRFALAMVGATAGQPELALEMYKKIIEEDPKHPVAAINACLPYNELVNTTEGLIHIGEMVRRMNSESYKYQTYDSNGNPVDVVAGICNGMKHIVRLGFQDGSYIRLTYDHVVFVENPDGSMSEKCARDIEPKRDRIVMSRNLDLLGGNPKTATPGIEITEELAWASGTMVGNGYAASSPNCSVETWEVKLTTQNQCEMFEETMIKYGVKFSTKKFYWGYLIRGYGLCGRHLWETLGLWGKTHAKVIPDWVRRCGSKLACRFIAGLYDTDGCIVSPNGFCLSNTSVNVIEGTQILLASVGIYSQQSWSDGNWLGKKNSANLGTSDIVSIKRFHSIIPLVHEDKAIRLKEQSERDIRSVRKASALVTSKEKAGRQLVYDIQTASGHFWASGKLVHNCFVQTLCKSTPQQLLEQRKKWYEVNKFTGVRKPHHKPQGKPIKVGYVSGDFKSHSAAMIFGNVVLFHDKSVVEPYFYSSLPVDPVADGATKKFQDVAAANWRDITNLTDEQADDLIRKDKIDILVDLAAHTNGGRLGIFVRKPAPIQVHAWGFAHGTGCKEVDFFLACPVSVPKEERQYYAEKIVDLPSIVTYLPPDNYGIKATSALPFFQNDHITFGSSARYEKLSTECLETFAEILRKVPESKIQFKDHGFRRPYSIKRVLSVFKDIDPKRVRFSISTSHPDHILSYQMCDLCLDPYPHGGGVVLMEQIWAGVPVLTLRGTQPSGRSAASVLTAMGRTDWIANTKEEYVDKAVKMANDVPMLNKVRKTLRKEFLESPSVKGYREKVELAYIQMVENYNQ